MKKTLLAMLLVGGTMSLFAQSTGSGTTTGTGSTTNPNPSTVTPATGTNTTTNGTMNNTTNGTMNNGTTNGTTTNGTWNNGTPSTGVSGTNPNGTWNGVSSPSTSWTPETAPSYGWNSYSNWPTSGSLYPTTTAGGYPIPQSTDVSGSMNSSSANSAYGTPVSALPANVQTRFGQDFPANVSNSYTWNQYGDWFHTYYANNGRLWQYYYSKRGDGYALALPVLQTYVPENIVASALNKYGSSLYSISMMKTNSGNNAYQVGLIQHGQISNQYLDDNGVSVADVWRTEELNATDANAAMGDSSGNANMNMNSQQNSNTDMNTQSASDQSNSDMNNQSSGSGKTKLKIKHEDGSIDKIKSKNGQIKVKSKPAPSNPDNQQ